MRFYKLIKNEKFIGVASSLDLRRYQHKHRIMLVCDEEKAQYIQCDNQYYHARWMLPIQTDKIQYSICEVIEIDEDEYSALLEAIETGKEIEIMPDEPIEDVTVDESDDVTVEFLRDVKLKEMSEICNQTITNGFYLVLSDGEEYHFSLTTQDQLNLITLKAMIDEGETNIPYHADGKLCRFYSADDIKAIITAATAHKTYHVSYFNSLKAYVGAIETMDEIKNVKYGMEIPIEYQSVVWKAINNFGIVKPQAE